VEKKLEIKRVGGRGQISVALIIVMTVILGAIGLGADAAGLHLNWVILQKGVDAAALAGAGYLENNSQSAPTAINVAVTYAQNNGIKNSELIADGGCNKAYVPGPNYTTITVTATVTARRTVPYAFFKLIGLSNGSVAASATAQMPLAAACVNCTSAVPTPVSQPTVIPGNFCTTVGQCDVLPIGLDASTPYQFDQAVTFNQGQVGPGNWGSLALGGTGGSNERTNIVDGYQGPLAINQWIDTEPGFKKGPVGQGFSDRIAQAQSEFSNGTFDNHSPNDPRAVILPMVVWNSPNGRSQVEITAFAAVWIDSESGGTIQAHFIKQEAFDSTGDAERSRRWRPRETSRRALARPRGRADRPARQARRVQPALAQALCRDPASRPRRGDRHPRQTTRAQPRPGGVRQFRARDRCVLRRRRILAGQSQFLRYDSKWFAIWQDSSAESLGGASFCLCGFLFPIFWRRIRFERAEQIGRDTGYFIDCREEGALVCLRRSVETGDFSYELK
jgi:hypothetical protein